MKTVRKYLCIILFIIIISAANISKPSSVNCLENKYLDLSDENFLKSKENYRKLYEDIIVNYYAKARFEDTIKELSKIYSNISNDIKDKLLFTMAKSYYKTGNKKQSYRYFQILIEECPKSEIIFSGKLNNAFFKIIQLENSNPLNAGITFQLKLYYLMKKINSSAKLLKSAEQYILSRIGDTIKISINLQNSRINDYDQFKYTIVSTIWNAFFDSETWMSEAIDIGKTVSFFQIDNSYNYFSKNLVVKIIIKDVYGVQSLKYIGTGMIETNLQELLQSLNITIYDFFNKSTDLYFYKDEF